jgi:hypothetical protein
MDDDLKPKSEGNINILRNSAKWMAIGAAILLGTVYMFWFVWSLSYDVQFIEIMYKHLAAVIGIPGAIITAFVLVNVLEQVSGPIKFSGLGFKFEGASGPVVMWVVVFLALVIGLKTLW